MEILKFKNIFYLFALVFVVMASYYAITETSNDDLRNYHGYKIKEVLLSRSASVVTIEDSLGHVIKKNFDNSELEDLIIGLKIK